MLSCMNEFEDPRHNPPETRKTDVEIEAELQEKHNRALLAVDAAETAKADAIDGLKRAKKRAKVLEKQLERFRKAMDKARELAK